MLYIPYEEAVEAMKRGLMRYLPEDDALHFAQIFAGNSLDGVHSHGLNRYPRYLADMESGLCNPRVTKAERVSGFGGLEVWDANFGVGPLIAEQMAGRAVCLAQEHGIACVALRNNSHWLRAGRYGLMMADAGMMGICFTNTCMNLTAWGAMEPSTGNNPITLAIPRSRGSLVMDMAVSQYAYGKLELMAQEGKMLDTPCGYDKDGRETRDPAKIIESGLMMPMAMWKGSALSIMLDLMASSLSLGRTSLMIGKPADGEKGMSQVFIALHPRAVVDMEAVEKQMEESLAFLHGLKTREGMRGVHAPGEGLAATRERGLRDGLPVAEQTWEKILAAGR
ncbi:MAG TPA: Ldh family oxidoreductase [Candidatus Ventricola intestinavium]|nr:Ldh family oxidoreductase [Candidatus Ventricola intestinavium]